MIRQVYLPWMPLIATSALILSAGCVGTTSELYIDSRPICDRVSDDIILRAVARDIVTAIIELPMMSNAKRPVTIAFLSMEKKTADGSECYDLVNKIRKELIAHSEGKMIFLDKEAMKAIYAERDAKRGGQVTTKGYRGLSGVDYFLTGYYAFSSRKPSANDTIRASWRYSLRLTDAETNQVVWKKDYECNARSARDPGYR